VELDAHGAGFAAFLISKNKNSFTMKNKSPHTGATKEKKQPDKTREENKNKQGTDKMPEQEKGKGDQVTTKNLKGKQVDEDPGTEEGKPLEDY
jgi:hypothetical protein